MGDDASKAYPDPSTTEFGIGAAYPTGDLEYAAGEPFVEGTTSQVVPRIPNDIYYDTATQAQELDEFLTIEAGQTPYDTYNFADIVGFVDSGLFQDMMSNDPDPPPPRRFQHGRSGDPLLGAQPAADGISPVHQRQRSLRPADHGRDRHHPGRTGRLGHH